MIILVEGFWVRDGTEEEVGMEKMVYKGCERGEETNM